MTKVKTGYTLDLMPEPIPPSDVSTNESELMPASGLIKAPEPDQPRTRLQQYLDSLEMPNEGDETVIETFRKGHAFRGLNARWAESQPPEVRAAYIRDANAQIKEKLPLMTKAVGAVIESRRSYNGEDSDRRVYPSEYYDVRAHDLKRLLELDFEPPADGSLGKYGEDLLLKFLVASFYEGKFKPFYSDVIGETLHDQVLIRESLKRIENVEGTLVSAIQVKFPTVATHFDMDVYLDQVAPDFYPDFRKAFYLGVEPKVGLSQRLESIRASQTVSVGSS